MSIGIHPLVIWASEGVMELWKGDLGITRFFMKCLPLGKMKTFSVLIFFPIPADVLNSVFTQPVLLLLDLSLDWELAPSVGACTNLLEQNGANSWGRDGEEMYWLFGGDNRRLVYPLRWWMGLNHHNKVLQGCFTICGCSLTAYENRHYCCFHVLTVSQESLHLSSPVLFSSHLFFFWSF